MIAQRTIVSGSTGQISQSLHQIKAFWVQMIDLDLFLKRHCHGNQYCGKVANSPYLLLWHSKMEWDIATSMGALTA